MIFQITNHKTKSHPTNSRKTPKIKIKNDKFSKLQNHNTKSVQLIKQAHSSLKKPAPAQEKHTDWIQ